jgi:shikimate kinase
VTIILCGLPGCGKTTIGKLLAEKMQIKFVDIDRQLEHTYNQGITKYTCREIYQLIGEPPYRLLEKQVVYQLDGKTVQCIATGGGTVLDPENVTHLKSLGTLAYLKGDFATLFERASKEGLPAFLDAANPWLSYQKLAQFRAPIYEKAADCIVEIQKPIEQLVQILSKMAVNYGK